MAVLTVVCVRIAWEAALVFYFLSAVVPDPNLVDLAPRYQHF